MERRIFSSFISLLACLTWLMPASAQETTGAKAGAGAEAKAEAPLFPLYNGTMVGLDLWGIGGKVFGSDFVSSEVSVDVNLKNRFFPVLEIGYGSTNATADNGTRYQSSAPYFRVGVNYNILYKKTFKNYFFVGMRYALSAFNYHITSASDAGNPNQPDNVWGDVTPPFDHRMKGSMHWIELYGGIRAHIWDSLYMSWGVRMKYRVTASAGANGDPWYVPGFGRYAANTMGVTYSITYLLPL